MARKNHEDYYETVGDWDEGRSAAEKDEQVLRMRKAGVPYSDIAATMGISVPQVYQMVQRGIAAIPRESAEEITSIIKAQLEYTTGKLLQIMGSFHPMVNNGKVMTNPATGEIVDDPLPKIAASRMVIAAADRVARLYGLDAPKTTVSITMDSIEADIRRLEQELGKQTRAEDDLLGKPPAKSASRKAIEGPPGFR